MEYDIAIVGGGPAGITAAIYGLRAGKSVVLFEGGELGGKLNIIENIENFPGFTGSGKDLARKMAEHLTRFDCKIIRKYVQCVVKTGALFDISSGKDNYAAKCVIYCGGFNRKSYDFADPYIGRGVSFCAVCDGAFYKDKTVAVTGGGHALGEEAAYLSALCRRVYVVSDSPLNLSAQNVSEFCPYKLSAIEGDGKVEKIIISGEKNISLDVDGVFLSAGGKAENILADLRFSSFITADKNGATTVPGLYAAGDIVDGSFKQVISACAAGAIAANNAVIKLNSAAC